MKIRRGKKSDLEDIHRSLNNTSELSIGAEESYSKEWVKRVISDKKNNLVLIIEEDKKIIGFLIAYFILSVKHLFLIDLYVDPNHRKKGIASRLFKECENIARKNGLKYVFGNVLENNKKMQKLMEKFRYKKSDKWYLYGKILE